MKKLSTIFLLSIYLFSTTETIEIFKIPLAIEHFFEHKVEKPGLSLFKFLSKHYFNGDPKDNDFEKDMKLPFKTPCDFVTAVTPAIVPQTITIFNCTPISFFEKKNYVVLNQCISSNYTSNIWQPPKFS